MSYFERIKKDGRKANPFFCLTGIDVVKAEPGTAMLTMPVRQDMYNGVGWLQGGMLVAIADEAMALALYPLLEKNEGIATIAESTSFIKGVQKSRKGAGLHSWRQRCGRMTGKRSFFRGPLRRLQ
jgi:acyl-CoA thioesterase